MDDNSDNHVKWCIGFKSSSQFHFTLRLHLLSYTAVNPLQHHQTSTPHHENSIYNFGSAIKTQVKQHRYYQVPRPGHDSATHIT